MNRFGMIREIYRIQKKLQRNTLDYFLTKYYREMYLEELQDFQIQKVCRWMQEEYREQRTDPMRFWNDYAMLND